MASVKTNKKITAAQGGEGGASMTTERTRGGNQVQGRKKKDKHIARFKLFLHRGILCMNFCVRVMPLACTLCTCSKPCSQRVKVWDWVCQTLPPSYPESPNACYGEPCSKMIRRKTNHFFPPLN